MGPFLLLTVNAEIFSRFTALAGTDAPCPVYTVSCANGMVGYVPPLEAYAEGAYEVAWAMFFYNQPRPRAGGLELLAAEARRLIAKSGVPCLSPKHLPDMEVVVQNKRSIRPVSGCFWRRSGR